MLHRVTCRTMPSAQVTRNITFYITRISFIQMYFFSEALTYSISITLFTNQRINHSCEIQLNYQPADQLTKFRKLTFILTGFIFFNNLIIITFTNYNSWQDLGTIFSSQISGSEENQLQLNLLNCPNNSTVQVI